VKLSFVEKDVMVHLQGSAWHTQLVCAFKSDNNLYLLLEYAPGRALDARIQWGVRLKRGGLPAVRFYAACALLALEHMHCKGVVHRDVKPSNFLIDGRGYLKLCDYGLSKFLKPGERTSTYLGTLAYIPPEQVSKVPFWCLCRVAFLLTQLRRVDASAPVKRTFFQLFFFHTHAVFNFGVVVFCSFQSASVCTSYTCAGGRFLAKGERRAVRPLHGPLEPRRVVVRNALWDYAIRARRRRAGVGRGVAGGAGAQHSHRASAVSDRPAPAPVPAVPPARQELAAAGPERPPRAATARLRLR
jgi:serine/threonine protein kinase